MFHHLRVLGWQHTEGVQSSDSFGVKKMIACIVWILPRCSEASFLIARVQRSGGRGQTLCWRPFWHTILYKCSLWREERYLWSSLLLSLIIFINQYFKIAINGSGEMMILMTNPHSTELAVSSSVAKCFVCYGMLVLLSLTVCTATATKLNSL